MWHKEVANSDRSRGYVKDLSRLMSRNFGLRLLFAIVAVDDFETVRASTFNENQQLSIRSVQ